ncbi:Carbohydrate ABC transporter membrane protein 2, CUT1 family [uncultured spirochete]|jgi:multiple sugar transport system permease protein|uniref:Carbohydrate ABC transporter membrane protein 2, CUT1 family n=1 Tax=uncultured spirochete TaxID=156406 RepID=A0A3P3XLU4_9SPIR|nr:carbohydrate ABC transporter permease [Rectinema subterraneum]SLM15212.1 Carbohydrate ABC transporter membrane protein 2, CUT1 family [uncultured spirochete]
MMKSLLKKRTRKIILNTIIAIVAFLVLAIELYPIVITVINGFRRDINILSGQPFQLKQLTLRSYELVLKNAGFRLGMQNSIIVGLLSTAISVLIGAMASYGIARFHFKGRNGLAYSFLVFRMLPQISLVISLYLMFSAVGLRDTISGITLAHTSFNVPYVIWLLLPFFTAVDKAYEEAAMVDGCTRQGVFFKIFLPIVAPGLVVAAVFAFLNSWNEFMYALILTGVKAKTAPIAINGLLGGETLTWGQACAAGTIMLVPVFIFTLGMQKFLIRGITTGGVKG